MLESPPRPRRHRSWTIALPLLGVLVLALAWSAVWFYAARTAEAAIETFLVQEAKRGNTYQCSSRDLGGYPFRLELRCADPVFDLKGAAVPVTVKAKQLVLVALIYRPNHVIAQARGPFSIDEPNQPGALMADWTLAEASIHGRPHMLERLSVVLEGAKFQRMAGNAPEPLGEARRIEFHMRPDAASSQAAPVFDLGARLFAATSPLGGTLTGRAIDGEVSAILRGLHDFSPKPLPQKLREWQAAGGRLEIGSARFQQGDSVAGARGALALTPNGRLDGTLQITIAGFERVAQDLASGDAQARVLAAALAGLAMLGERTELEGRRAARVPLRFAQGAISLGPVPIGQTIPLF